MDLKTTWKSAPGGPSGPPGGGGSRGPSSSRPSAPTLAIPDRKAGRSYGETFGASSFTGEVTLTLPLPANEARLGPNLSLSYAHGGANGVFGLGMSLSLGTISRRIDGAIPRYDDTDIFLGPDGQDLTPGLQSDGKGGWVPWVRSVVEGGVTYSVRRFPPRVDGAAVRIERWTGPGADVFWRVRDEAGGVTVFGRTALARIADPAAPWRIASWLPEETVDALGNRLVYHYVAEDDLGWSGASFPSPAQRYLSEVRYGNYRLAGSGAGGEGDERFAFSLVFDYGQYDPLSGNAAPVRPWPARSDPQTSFRTGFPVQTLRLCRGVFSVNALPEASTFGSLVDEVLSLSYSSPSNHKLTQVQLTGQRRSSDGTLQASALPPLTLDYAPFDLSGASWRKLTIAGAEVLPSAAGGALLSFADVHGEGLPGVVLTSDTTLSYAPPLGDGRYGALEPLPRLPAAATAPGYALRDLDGTGRLSLTVNVAEYGGFYASRADGGWDGFRAFPSYAAEAASPNSEWVDLDGDGLADVLVAAGDQTRVYLSRGTEGFAPPLTLTPKPATRDVGLGGEARIDTYADLIGDGLQHRVRIRSGRVDVWPNLGYGRFGARISWPNAPSFGESITADRILLTQVTGGGGADLLLIYPDHGLLYPNAGVAGFGAPVRIDMPCAIGPNTTVSTVDLLGNGHSCLIVAQQDVFATTWWLDLCGKVIPDQLIQADNGMGGQTRIAYRSSTDFYLADRERGKPWLTRLAFPVIVVERLDHFDAINALVNSEQHQYRDGYFDPAEQRFRGFGFVQSINARAIDDQLWRFPSPAANAEAIGGQAQLVKQWSYTGAFRSADDEIAAYSPDFFPQGAGAPTPGGSVLAPPLRGQNADTVREATAALAGMPIRSETWGVAPDGTLSSAPFTVEADAQTVMMLQPHVAGAPSSVMVVPRESLTFHHEGVAAEPRIEQDATLAWDAYGRPTRTAAVFYPRPTPLTPAQGQLRITAALDGWINQDSDDIFLIGLPYETESLELAGLEPGAGGYFSYEALASGVADALANPIDYGQPWSAGPEARPFARARTYYWDAAGQDAMPLGYCGPRPLPHHGLDAVFPPSLVASTYGGAVTDAMLQAAELTLDAGLWWAPGAISYFADAAGYYQPIGFQTVFQTQAAHTVLTYDPYWLFVTRSTDALGFAVTSTLDYQALEPSEVRDENGMVTQALYSPLKRLLVISQHAMIQGQWRGGMDLANYQPRPRPDLATLVADPMAYLQGARGFFLPGYAVSGPNSQPSYLVSIEAMADIDAAAWDGEILAQPGVNIGYLDGFGRSLEALQRVEVEASPEGEGTGWLWRSPARADYDHQERVLRSYVPVFQDDHTFHTAGARAFTAYQYDALDRQVRVDTAKGFVLLSTYPDGWTTQHWDADDTVLTSPYYRDHINDPNLPAAEKRALEQAARFADTPTSERLDPQGHSVRIDEINVDAANARSTLSTTLTVDARGLVTEAVDPRLSAAPGLRNLSTVYDMGGRAIRVTRADSGEERLLRDALGQTVRHWTARGDQVETVYETLVRRPSRLLLTPKGAETPLEIATFAYGTDPAAQTVNRLVRQQDQAGVEVTAQYGLGGRETQATRQFTQSPVTPIDWSAAPPLQDKVWSLGWRYDPSGRLLQEICADASIVSRAYFANGWVRDIAVTPSGSATSTVVQDSLRYEADGQACTARYGDGLDLAWAYDPLTGDLVASTVRQGSTGTPVQDLTYVYDPHSNVSTVIDKVAASLMGGPDQTLAKQYTFDGLYQLTNATGWETARAVPPWRNYDQTLSYDLSGNLIAVAASNAAVDLTVAATSNHAVEQGMLDHGGTVESFFDAAGNLLQLADASALTYDFDNRLVSVTPTGQQAATVRYGYAQNGARLRKSDAQSNTYHLASAYIEVEGQTTRTALLIPGAHGDALFVGVEGATLSPSYLVTDRLGSVTLELGGDGGLQRYQDYYPYGGLSISLAPDPPDLPARIAFAGKERDAETGLSFFGGRYYVSAWGRWLTADPQGEIDGLNLYQYVDGNPITHSDPTGFGISKTGRRRRKALTARRRRAPGSTSQVVTMTVKGTIHYGSDKTFGAKGYGGAVMKVSVGSGSGVFSFWVPRSGNTGKGISRQYPITNVHYRQPASQAVLKRRVQRSMFRSADKTQFGYVRGHQIPHADTMVNSPLSGGLISTRDKQNYYPEPEGWGEQQRKHREGKGRGRETPLVQYNEYSSKPKTTNDGTPIPDRIYFIELTGWSTDKTYANSKSYNIKAYSVDYATFDYDSMPRKNASDRRQTKGLRVFSLPPGVIDMVGKQTGYTTAFKF